MKKEAVANDPLEHGDQEEKLESVSIKCTPEDKVKIRAAIKELGGAKYATLINSLLARMGFKFGADSQIAEIGALKTCLIQLHNEYVERITEVLDGLGKQMSSSEDVLKRTVTEAAEQQLSNETTLRNQRAEIESLRERADTLLRENTALRESLNHASRIIALHETSGGLADQFNGLKDQIEQIKNQIKK
jgi:chromosome segregation ATPase